METGMHLRRLAATSAVMASALGGFSGLAQAATRPTATLDRGTVTVTGTAARDVIAVTLDADRLAVDFGLDGTIDAQFARSRVKRLNVVGGRGNDGLSVQGPGVGDVPVTIRGGAGNDGGGVVGNIGDFGDGDA